MLCGLFEGETWKCAFLVYISQLVGKKFIVFRVNTFFVRVRILYLGLMKLERIFITCSTFFYIYDLL